MLFSYQIYTCTYRPAINFSGLEAPPEKSFQLTFHVMIPKTYWEWDSKSSVHIRFGHPKLGEWSDCGNFQEIRYIENFLLYLKFIYY